jgi:hypothetical protein
MGPVMAKGATPSINQTIKLAFIHGERPAADDAGFGAGHGVDLSKRRKRL